MNSSEENRATPLRNKPTLWKDLPTKSGDREDSFPLNSEGVERSIEGKIQERGRMGKTIGA